MNNIKSEVYSYLRQYRELYGCEILVDFDQNRSSASSKNISYNKKKLLDDYENEINLCQKCDIAFDRNNFVFGSGDPNADLFLVGEAPGRQEDLKGLPFVGQAGKLLDKILSAINRNRNKGVYIANILKCRPPKNRDPLQSEIDDCIPYLRNQINKIQPKLIMALGKVAANALLSSDNTLIGMRNITHEYDNFPLRVTYHPAALLRNPELKKPTWDDFKFARDYLTK